MKSITHHESRRSFLRRTAHLGVASAVAGLLEGVESALAGPAAEDLPDLSSRPSTAPIQRAEKSIVAHVRRAEVIDGPRIHPVLLREMIEDGLCAATGQKNPGDAWNKLLTHDDVVAIKFNQVGAKELNTSAPFVVGLVNSLKSAGIAPEHIVLIEAPDDPSVRALKTQPRVFGWRDPAVSFGSGTERLAAVLDQATAIISVPFLKTHNIAGMTGCLKNLSHALIQRPKLYHGNACAPYVGDIVALPQIRSKLRLHVVNALRVVFRDGPAVRPGTFWEHAGVLVSTDPVAADSVGIDIINGQRAKAQLPLIGDIDAHVPHVHAAVKHGLGTDDQDYIQVVNPTPI